MSSFQLNVACRANQTVINRLETRDEKMKIVSFDSKSIFEDTGKMNKDDIRRVTVFLVYILTSFFGVGNIARYVLYLRAEFSAENP